MDLEQKRDCLWIDPTMKSGYYVTDSLLASVYISYACVKYPIPFKSLLHSWWRIIALCKPIVKQTRGMALYKRFFLVLYILSSQGLYWEEDSRNFIYDYTYRGKFNCASGCMLLYAIFEALDPSILSNVYFVMTPSHIYLLLKDGAQWYPFETTDTTSIRLDNKFGKDFSLLREDLTEKEYKQHINYISGYADQFYKKIGNVLGLLLAENTQVKSDNSFRLLITKQLFAVVIYENRKWKETATPEENQKLLEILRHVTFCSDGTLEAYFCATVLNPVISTKPTTDKEMVNYAERQEVILKRIYKLREKCILKLCKEIPFKTFFFRDKKSIKILARGLYVIFSMREKPKIILDIIENYVDKNPLPKVPQVSKLI